MRADITVKDEEKDYSEVIRNAQVRQLMSKRPAEIEAWIDANVNDVASVKALLTLTVKLLVAVLRREASRR